MTTHMINMYKTLNSEQGIIECMASLVDILFPHIYITVMDSFLDTVCLFLFLFLFYLFLFLFLFFILIIIFYFFIIYNILLQFLLIYHLFYFILS